MDQIENTVIEDAVAYREETQTVVARIRDIMADHVALNEYLIKLLQGPQFMHPRQKCLPVDYNLIDRLDKEKGKVPVIKLSGQWLAAAGFDVKPYAEIISVSGLVVIIPRASRPISKNESTSIIKTSVSYH